MSKTWKRMSSHTRWDDDEGFKGAARVRPKRKKDKNLRERARAKNNIDNHYGETTDSRLYLTPHD